MISAAKKQKSKLSRLAAAINKEHGKIVTAIRTCLNRARAAGDYLHHAKKIVGHCKWGKWVEEHVKCSERSAQAYMQIAANWGKLEAITQTTAGLTIQQALRLIAEKDDSADPHGDEYAAAKSGAVELPEKQDPEKWEKAIEEARKNGHGKAAAKPAKQVMADNIQSPPPKLAADRWTVEIECSIADTKILKPHCNPDWIKGHGKRIYFHTDAATESL